MPTENTSEHEQARGARGAMGHHNKQQSECEPKASTGHHAQKAKHSQTKVKAGAGSSSTRKDDEQLTEAPSASGANVEEGEEHYIRGVLTRGEAAPEDQAELEPGQTHRIVGEDESGNKQIERERYSAW